MATIPSPAGALPIRAVFGPTIQGEGPMAGRLAAFIRFGGCNLHCPPCDTKDTWDTGTFSSEVLAELNPPRTAEQVVMEVMALAPTVPPLVVLTGGEPLLHQRSKVFADILAGLPAGTIVQVETNGTVVPVEQARELVYVVSPKVSGPMAAADPAARRIKPTALAAFAALSRTSRAWFKFDCATPDDVTTAARFCDEHLIDPSRAGFIMPEGDTFTAALTCHRDLMPAILAHGFNTTTRLHLALEMP